MLETEYQRNYDWKNILNTLNVLNMHMLLIMHIYMAKIEDCYGNNSLFQKHKEKVTFQSITKCISFCS